MNRQTFSKLWAFSAKKWYDEGFITVDNCKTSIKSLCTLVDGIDHEIHRNYEIIKRTVKEWYFKDSVGITINRYKRAAVIVQAVFLAEPLRYKLPELGEIDYFFLKQRLAFYVALISIVYSYDGVDLSKGELFNFERLDANLRGGEDDFLSSIYKDIFFAELYNNYNILTMANVFGMLTETSSVLPKYNLKI